MRLQDVKTSLPVLFETHNWLVLNTRNKQTIRDEEERSIFLLFLHGEECNLKTSKNLANLLGSSCTLWLVAELTLAAFDAAEGDTLNE